MAQLAEQLTCNQQVIGSSPIIGFYYLDGFPSGQRGQTVNLLATLSKVRILPHPLNIISRGGAVWKLVGLITRRSQVQILSPQLIITKCLILLYDLTDLIKLKSDKQYAQIAQSVEQRTENPCVTGSIPVLGIFFCLKAGCGIQ